MKCDLCNIREASVHLTEVINDKMNKLHICEVCAKQKSDEMQSHFGLTDLISGLMDLGPTIADDEIQENIQIKCPGCGMTYHDFQKVGKLGCGQCYDVFSDRLSDLLKKIHGSDRHIGKMPMTDQEVVNNVSKIQELRDELKDLVNKEEFEKAAIVRDRIRDIENNHKSG